MASARVQLGLYEEARVGLLDLLSTLPVGATTRSHAPPGSLLQAGCAQMETMGCTEAELVSRALHLLAACYGRDVSEAGDSGAAVCRMVVLAQHEWPRHAACFTSLADIMTYRYVCFVLDCPVRFRVILCGGMLCERSNLVHIVNSEVTGADITGVRLRPDELSTPASRLFPSPGHLTRRVL